MIKYDESLYDIVKTTLKSIDDINNYKKIVDTMSSTSIQLKDKISALYTYLKNINVNILEINTLLVNQDIQNILNNNYQVISNIDIQQLETNIKTVITGCVAQVEKEKLLENEFVDLVVGNDEKLDLYKILSNFEEKTKRRKRDLNPRAA